MLEIRQIPKTNQDLVQKCVEIAKTAHFDNIVLLGDLFPPCIKLTDIYGIFDHSSLISFFTIFKGFRAPSVVLPSNPPGIDLFILGHLDKLVQNEFTLVSFTLKEEELINHFHILEISYEYCMFINRSKFTPVNYDITFNRVNNASDSRIDMFYRSHHTYPWNPIQLESDFYYYLEIKGEVIACGGTHFETPDVAHLGNIIVVPEYRGRSYGIALVSTITGEILRIKTYATLFVTQDNIPAINLYKKLGYSHHKPVSIFSCKKRI